MEWTISGLPHSLNVIKQVKVLWGLIQRLLSTKRKQTQKKKSSCRLKKC
jgi:hypothetical protein